MSSDDDWLLGFDSEPQITGITSKKEMALLWKIQFVQYFGLSFDTLSMEKRNDPDSKQIEQEQNAFDTN